MTSRRLHQDPRYARSCENVHVCVCDLIQRADVQYDIALKLHIQTHVRGNVQTEVGSAAGLAAGASEPTAAGGTETAPP